MMKKIQEEEKKDQQNPERKLENKNEVISFLSYFANVPDPYSNSHTTIQSFITTGCPVDRAYTIFHPPALA